MDFIGILVMSGIIGELIMSLLWVPLYFTNGLLLYRKSIPYNSIGLHSIDFDNISVIAKRPLSHRMIFHNIDNNSVAFREKLLEFTLFSYAPIMHGLIRFNKYESTIIIKGYINWTVLCIPLMLLQSYDFGIYTNKDNILKHSIIFFVVVIVFSYVAQYFHYNRIYKALSDATR